MRSSIRQFFFAVAAALALSPGLRIAGAAEPDNPRGYSLYLRYEGAVPASPGDVVALHEKAVAIVQSSNDNSGAPKWKWDLAGILRGYRRAVDGHYLLVTYAEPQSIKTTGGVVTVKEIVIGLNHSQYANSLHTIDDEGRIVGHSKYSGELCIDLLNLVLSMDQNRVRRSGNEP